MNKKTFTHKKRKAFSLIELSIVLIIIGLLVAGVTGGASLIKNAELRSVASEARGYQTAVNSFYAKYNGLPGDLPTAIGALATAPSTVILGNNDGIINFISPNAAVGGRLEGNIAWLMLKNDNFVNDSFTPGPTDAATTTTQTVTLSGGTNVPASKSKNGGWAFDNITVNGAAQNVIVLFGGTTLAFTAHTTATAYAMSVAGTPATTPTVAIASATSAAALGNAQLLPTEALSIDAKVDDGIANTGKVSALLGAAGNCSNTTTYTTATAFKACALAFQVDPNS